MIAHWKSINFEPTNFRLEADSEETGPYISDKDYFSPVAKLSPLVNSDTEQFSGVLIKNLPEALPGKELRLLLTQAGLDEDHSLKIEKFGGKMTVEINNVDNKLAKNLINFLNNTKVYVCFN